MTDETEVTSGPGARLVPGPDCDRQEHSRTATLACGQRDSKRSLIEVPKGFPFKKIDFGQSGGVGAMALVVHPVPLRDR